MIIRQKQTIEILKSNNYDNNTAQKMTIYCQSVTKHNKNLFNILINITKNLS